MSRFDAGRWNRILIWTGAALAWGTALVVSRLEPAREIASLPDPVAAQTADASAQAIMPNSTPLGLVILRYTPVDAPPAEVRTVLVERVSPSSSPAPSAQAAPQPASSGS
jgi:hypothetical protein